MPVVDCIVAASPNDSKDDGKPVMLFFSATCTAEQIKNNDVVYEVERRATDLGYEDPMVTFLRDNGPRWLFEHFIDPMKIDISDND